MSSIKLSLVIITFNEEKNIERCIKAAAMVADEIIVIDSFSTDQTAQICAKIGNIRFFQHFFLNYSQQKNYGIEQAKYPYILSLDADEVLSERLQKEILAVKKNWQFDGYFLNRLTNFCGQWIRYCGWYPDRKLRLWDSRQGRWQGDGLHETLVLKATAKTGHLKENLLHYSFNTIQEHLQQIDKFTDISARDLFKQDKKPGVYTLYFKAFVKFWFLYLFKLGILEGYSGWVICINSAHADFIKYAKLKELWNKKEKEPLS